MSDGRFRSVPSQVSFPEIEEQVLERWRAGNVFHRSLEQRKGAPEFVFYEGPPTANGKPGVHHVLARVFKDIYPRFQTMRGRHVGRKGGWDCHGLPVELEIERELGLSSKKEIEEFGIEEFNKRCRESVLRYVGEWERLTERVAYWVDLGDAYKTMTNDYVESVWWSLKQLFDQGLLEEDYKSVPYCPRCGTALSDHEVAQGYTTVTDPSVFVRFPLTDEPNTSLLVWTTTPWTLPSNAAAAIHPEVSYVVAEHEGERLILAEPLVHRVLGPDAKIVEWLDAGALENREYTPPFTYVSPEERAWYVISAEFVTTEDGTGIVHIAPAYGAEDLEAGRQFGLPVIALVDDDGKFVAQVTDFAGRPVKEADPDVIENMRARGVLFRSETIEHTYPLCWRCDTPLLYMARSSWFIRTKSRKDDLLASNEDVTWHPDHIKHGRFGDWLANNIDWSLSRDRYWGTPLPVWRCANKHLVCIGGSAELSERAGRDLSQLDLHKPYVDEITFPCGECSEEMRRVKPVIDAWYDSGSMPFAQLHYPFSNKDVFEARFPAHYICEAIDQTRGWFYSLLAISTLLFGKSSYERVVCLGHIVDKDGRKMSKSLGNVINPWDILEKQGADALRWYLFTVGSPWSSRRVYMEAIDDVVSGFMRMLWNVYSFYVLYANTDDIDPTAIDVPAAARHELDRWILAELHDTIRTVTTALDEFDATSGGRRITQFVDDLSNWYVRRSRRRFWKDASDDDKASAHATLYECLVAMSMMLAPYTPFLADELWNNLVAGVRADAPESVHLADWLAFDPALIDEALRTEMATVRRAVALGLQVRTNAKIKVRQPLASVTISGTGAEGVAHLSALIADELNVKDVLIASSIPDASVAASASDAGLTVTLDTKITAELRAEGAAREIVRAVQNLRKRSGLAVSDRIALGLEMSDEVWSALQPHAEWISGEVLSTQTTRTAVEGAEGKAEVKVDGAAVAITIKRA